MANKAEEANMFKGLSSVICKTNVSIIIRVIRGGA